MTLFLRYFSQTFPYKFHSKFSCQLHYSCPLTLPNFMSWKLPSWGIQELELGYPTANEEHEPFVVYEIFLKNFPTNFPTKIPASCSVNALCTHQVSSLCKIPRWGTRELELWYPSQYGRLYAKVTLFLRNFSENFPDEFDLEFSCQLLNMCPLYSPSFISLKTT